MLVSEHSGSEREIHQRQGTSREPGELLTPAVNAVNSDELISRPVNVYQRLCTSLLQEQPGHDLPCLV